jgi:SHC-transforming protein 1
MRVLLLINTQNLRVTEAECAERLFNHTMQNISFACGGDADIQNYIAYVAKDDANGRACYVFECSDGLAANDVITTIGQAFELRFKKFLDSNNSKNSSLSSTVSNSSPPKLDSLNTNGENNKMNSVLPSSIAATLKQQQQQPQSILKSNAKQMTIESSPISILSSKGPPQIQQKQLNVNVSTVNSNKFSDDLEMKPWFHGLMTRDKAEQLLIKDGDYLVRETQRANQQYVLSGRYKNECRHIFLVDPTGVVRTKDRHFESISHLIKFHQDNHIPIISKDNELLLVTPIIKHNRM